MVADSIFTRKAFTKIVSILVVFSSLSLHAADSIYGTSKFKLELPKPKTKTVIAARYVLDQDQELAAMCPDGFKAKAVACDANARSFTRGYINDDISLLPSFTKSQISNLENSSKGTCGVVFVRPAEIVKLSLSLFCEEQMNLSSASTSTAAN